WKQRCRVGCHVAHWRLWGLIPRSRYVRAARSLVVFGPFGLGYSVWIADGHFGQLVKVLIPASRIGLLNSLIGVVDLGPALFGFKSVCFLCQQCSHRQPARFSDAGQTIPHGTVTINRRRRRTKQDTKPGYRRRVTRRANLGQLDRHILTKYDFDDRDGVVVMQRTWTFQQHSVIVAPASAVWRWVVTPRGIND